MSRVTRGASNLGKIARDFGVKLPTLRKLINVYPDLQKEIAGQTKGCKHPGAKTLPPKVVDKIYDALGEP